MDPLLVFILEIKKIINYYLQSIFNKMFFLYSIKSSIKIVTAIQASN